MARHSPTREDVPGSMHVRARDGNRSSYIGTRLNLPPIRGRSGSGFVGL